MANLSSFFGQAIGSGTATDKITDPRKLPVFGNRWTNSYFKYTASNYDTINSQNFWNGMAYQCDETFNYHILSAENTWETFVDYSGGAGGLYWVISPGTNAQIGTESWVRITVDGTVYTFKKQNFGLGEPASTYSLDKNNPTTAAPYHDRLFWGTFTDLPQTSSGYGPTPNGYYEHGEHRYDPANQWGTRPDKYGVRSPNQYTGVLTVASMKKWQLPYVAFENSLKVEFYGTTGLLDGVGSFSNYGAVGWSKETIIEI